MQELRDTHLDECGELLGTVLLGEVARDAWDHDDDSLLDAVSDLLEIPGPRSARYWDANSSSAK